MRRLVRSRLMDGDAASDRTLRRGDGSIGYSARIAGGGPQPLNLPALRASPPAETRQLKSRERDRPKSDDKPDEDDDDKGQDAKPPMPPWKKRLYWIVGIVLVAALITAGVLYWMHARQFETTDDAFIDGHISQVSAQIGGRVTRLAFDDNQDVRAGQLLVEIDPRDYDIRIRQAEGQRSQSAAQLSQAQAQLVQQQAAADQAQANVRVTEAELVQAQADLARFRAVDQRAVTRQQLDSATATARSTEARLDAVRQSVAGARAQVVSQAAQVEASAAALELADVGIANARLQLSYARLAAPVDGRVTRRTVEVGNYVNPGQALLAVVEPNMWVTANFKETQLAMMHPGQAVRIRVDACPDLDLPAHVDSFQAGSGSAFSSLPAENATGNYVKVVQRVPVKIVFDGDRPASCRIAPGLSVAPRVTVR